MSQVSVLSSLLFRLYINDVSNFVQKGVSLLFAADTKIIYTFQPEALCNTVAKITQGQISLNTG